MLGGRPVQDVTAELRTDASALGVRGWNFVPRNYAGSLTGQHAKCLAGPFQGRPQRRFHRSDALMMWLQGRGDLSYRSQKPLRARPTSASHRIVLRSMA